MVVSTPNRIPSTPPPGVPKRRIRKPSEKVLEAQQSLQPRTITTRSPQTGARTAALQLPQNEGLSGALVQYELPRYITAQGSPPAEGEGGSGMLQDLRELIVSLKETIVQQSGAIAN